jgi:hypothetical protein
MESIIDFLKRKLKDAGPSRWEAIAAELNEHEEDRPITFHTLRKIAYGERDNLGSVKAERVRDYFLAVERGERDLPSSEFADKAKA